MASLLSYVTDLPMTPPSADLPSSFKALLEKLGLKADSAGFKLMGDVSLPGNHNGVVPRIFRIEAPYQLKDFRLTWSSDIGALVMTRAQAAAYLQSEILSPRQAGPCTVWIPFADGEGERSFAHFVIRIYRRAEGSTEVFFYETRDDSDWDHKGDYFLVLDKYGA